MTGSGMVSYRCPFLSHISIRRTLLIILSVDYGDARTGIAVCDRGELLASPVTVIKESWPPKVAAVIDRIAKEKGAERIVVGYPKSLNVCANAFWTGAPFDELVVYGI